jgi:hypothetical protein
LQQVTAKNQKKIWARQSAVEKFVKGIHVLAESQLQLIQLALNDQLSLFKDRIDTVTGAIKQLCDKKISYRLSL